MWRYFFNPWFNFLVMKSKIFILLSALVVIAVLITQAYYAIFELGVDDLPHASVSPYLLGITVVALLGFLAILVWQCLEVETAGEQVIRALILATAGLVMLFLGSIGFSLSGLLYEAQIFSGIESCFDKNALWLEKLGLNLACGTVVKLHNNLFPLLWGLVSALGAGVVFHLAKYKLSKNPLAGARISLLIKGIVGFLLFEIFLVAYYQTPGLVFLSTATYALVIYFLIASDISDAFLPPPEKEVAEEEIDPEDDLIAEEVEPAEEPLTSPPRV